jgi:hypothetical protein
VYCRFGAVALAMTFSVHQNIIKILMYVETGQDQSRDGSLGGPFCFVVMHVSRTSRDNGSPVALQKVDFGRIALPWDSRQESGEA